MFPLKKIISLSLMLPISFFVSTLYASDINDIIRLKTAYPEFIIAVNKNAVIWADGSKMPLYDGSKNKTLEEKLNHPALIDQVKDVYYQPGFPSDRQNFLPIGDPGRIRYEAFFRKMYGDTESEVVNHLTLIYWMPKFFQHKYPLLVTRINGIDKKLTRISQELETLVTHHSDYLPYLENPGGTFKWRNIANTNRLSAHSFGMTIDINSTLSNYWQWDLKKEGKEISEDATFDYKNNIPWPIVIIFEQQGFIWGGKWRHYDTMHFEYRPELFYPFTGMVKLQKNPRFESRLH